MPLLWAMDCGFCWCVLSPRSIQPLVLKYTPGWLSKYSRYRSLLPMKSVMQSWARGMTRGTAPAASPTRPLLHRP